MQNNRVHRCRQGIRYPLLAGELHAWQWGSIMADSVTIGNTHHCKADVVNKSCAYYLKIKKSHSMYGVAASQYHHCKGPFIHLFSKYPTHRSQRHTYRNATECDFPLIRRIAPVCVCVCACVCVIETYVCTLVHVSFPFTCTSRWA